MKKKTNTKKRNIILISIAAIMVIALIVAKKQGMIGAEELQKISTQEIETGSIIEAITASGKIQPEREILIAPDASGEIKGIFVKEGDSVKEGQLLLKINPDVYLSTMDKVRANVNSSKANLASSKARYSQSESQLIKAENNFKRQKQLYEKEV
ncbi:MAG: biotin/lipoyl-binding protein, partial [Bacteroidales bacterium]|nr:biotin/lipoyl-binding protein [Bacteroidales bacterium]